MKKYFPVVAVLLLSPFFLQAQDSSYTIRGNFSEVKDGLLYLRYQTPAGAFKYDSSRVINGKFSFEGSSEFPMPAMLFFKPGITKKYASDMLTIYLDPAHIFLSGKGDSLSKLVIKGSPLSEDKRILKNMTDKLSAREKELKLLHDKVDAGNVPEDSLEKATMVLNADKRKIFKDFILAHPASLLSAMLIMQYFDYDTGLNDVAPLYDNLTARIKKTDEGKKVKKMVDAYTVTDTGKYLPEISQPDTSGNTQQLSQLKGKFVLVDFWASWCNPCRAEFDNLRKSYAKFHGKGFEIYGISYDNKSTQAAWMSTISKSLLPGIQVSSLTGWYNITSDLFWIKGIPANFLLDKDGKIIAKDLIGEALPARLAELMP